MRQILDYDALFNERGEQANICTDAGIGGSYTAGRAGRQAPEDSNPSMLGFTESVLSDRLCGNRLTREIPRERPIRGYDPLPGRRPVRYVEFDTFEHPEQTGAEAKACMEKTALLFCSIITAIVAIAILL